MALTFSGGEPLEAPQLNNMVLGMKGWGVISGFAVTQNTPTADMSVDVPLGTAVIDNVVESETGTTHLSIDAAHATLYRKDLITYDASANTPAVVKGNNHAGGDSDPIYPPDIPSGDILLAIVDVDANETAISTGDIHDGRVIVDEGSRWNYSGASEFSGNAPTSWTDLNIASTVGANRAIAILKIKQTGTSNQAFAFRPNGDSDEYYRALGTTSFPTPTNFDLATNQATLVTAITDASGIIEWRAQSAVATTIHVLAWSKLAA